MISIALYCIYRYYLKIHDNISEIRKEGKKISAEIIDSKTISSVSRKYTRKSLILEFKNFNNIAVRQRMEIKDSKPKQMRFKKGNNLNLIIDETFTKCPYIIVDLASIEKIYNLYLLFFIVIAVISGYYFYVYRIENQGYGWRFLDFGHPLILSPLISNFFLILGLIIYRMINKRNCIINRNLLKLKIKGIKTSAEILNITETNKNIKTRFKVTLQYNDKKNRSHEVKLDKAFKLNYIDNKCKEIFYLPEEPENIAFLDDLNSI